MAEYSYDEQGYNFCYFLLSVLSLVLVPVTAHSVYKTFQSFTAKGKEVLCECGTCQKERARLAKSRPNRVVSLMTRPKFLFIVAGWIAVALLAYQVSFAEAPKQHFDPYEILGITEGATEKDIKRVYKKLSLVYHPDKAQPGTERESEERFIQISKAYQSLTDPEVRKNYEQYGHPDGKQSFTMGVALPQKMIEGGNSRIVLAIYALIFGLGLPFYIARWWYNSRRHTKDKILNASMRIFVKELKENADFKALIDILAGAHEFKEGADCRAGEDVLLKSIDSAIIEELGNRGAEKYERLESNVPAYRRKARTLLYAHFLRLDLTSKASASEIKALQKDQRFLVERSIHLLQGLLQIAIVKQWLGVATSIMDTQQHLIQATFPGEPSIKQLPHITAPLLRKYYRAKGKHVFSAQQLLNMSEDGRKTLLKPLDESQYLDVVEVANRIPRLRAQKAVFQVVGDKIITTGAVITFILKLANINADLPEEEEDEEDQLLDEMGETTKKDKENGTLPAAHSPYYAAEKKPCWWVFLGDPKVNRILVPPRKVTDITAEKTIQIPFPGPPKAGTYTFSLFVKSDTYSGTDIMQDIQLTIHDKDDLPPEEEVDDTISEPEEDSIAGQMKLMREQGLASAIAGGASQGGEGRKADDSDSDSSDDE